MYSTEVPMKFRFCTDTCPKCHQAFNFPSHVLSQDANGIQFDYMCRNSKCGNVWGTFYSKHVAHHLSANALFTALSEGLKAIDSQDKAAGVGVK